MPRSYRNPRRRPACSQVRCPSEDHVPLSDQSWMHKATTPFTFNIDEDVHNTQLDSAKFLQGGQQVDRSSGGSNPNPDDIPLDSEKSLQGVQQAGSKSGDPKPNPPNAKEQFTFENITESGCFLITQAIILCFYVELPRLIKLPICFTNPPSDSNAGIILSCQDRGGYGDICEVKLHEPLEVL